MGKLHFIAVMPVFNEEGAIESVINKWANEFKRLRINFQIHVYNDGSTDNTFRILNAFATKNKNFIIHDKTNSGHGPTILQGYRENSDTEWIFQIDSDDEVGPESFERLWVKRNEYDFLIGKRVGCNRPLIRQFISAASRIVVKVFYGAGVYDVNVPYRLMRSNIFKDTFNRMPLDTFAPNVIISGIACLKKCRILEVPVSYRFRATGEVSIKSINLFKVAIKSMFQTIMFRFNSIR